MYNKIRPAGSLMPTGEHWEDKRDRDALRMLKLLTRYPQYSRAEIAYHLGWPISRVRTIVNHTRDPESHFRPVYYVRGKGWCVVSHNRNEEALLEHELRTLSIQRGIFNSRENAVVLSHQHLGSKNPITRALESSVLPERRALNRLKKRQRPVVARNNLKHADREGTSDWTFSPTTNTTH